MGENNGEHSELATEPVGRLEHYLTEHGVEHEMIEHGETMTALAEAREAGVEADEAAKAVLLLQGDRHLMAVIPASARLDLAKVAERVGDAEELRLASEQEMKAIAPGLELGALPPIGPDLPAPELLDEQLLEHGRILCNSGDHRHSVLIPPGAILELADPIVGGFCEG
jgi:Ala-tRNA(Pro) deacylase